MANEYELRVRVKRGDTKAMLELAQMYGGTSTEKGLWLIKKAAKASNVLAQTALTIYYYEIADSIYQQGFRYAVNNISEIRSNLNQAQLWGEKAYANGAEAIKDLLDKINKRLWSLN